MKPIQEILWAKEKKRPKIFPMGAEAGISLTALQRTR